MTEKVLYSIKNISKYFPGVKALQNVSFDICEGDVHAIVGENGAGKSTLMNILSGVYAPSAGTLVFNGEQVELKSARHAQDLGISMIHQELSLSPALSIAENIFVGRLPKKKSGFLDTKKMYCETETALKQVGLEYLRPHELVRDINSSQQQLVEIAKAMALNTRLVIMDEPTSSLTKGETEYLFRLMRKLKERKVTILYISHKLDEIMEMADTVTVLRDGEHILTTSKCNLTVEKMISHMVGRVYDVKHVRESFIQSYENRKVLLEVKNLKSGSKVKDVSFRLYEGEILGITGLVGSGRSELLQAIYGGDKHNSGTIKIDNRLCDVKNPTSTIKCGLALLPEGRKTQSVFLKMSVQDNATMLHLKKMRTKLGFISKAICKRKTSHYIEKLNIKTPSQGQLAENLSGGNQQKVVLARCLMNQPSIILMDEPTQGIDVGAKEEIYQIMNGLVHEGASIIMVSSEMQETISMCDRVLVMHEGRITGEMLHSEVTDEKILLCASGGKTE